MLLLLMVFTAKAKVLLETSMIVVTITLKVIELYDYYL